MMKRRNLIAVCAAAAVVCVAAVALLLRVPEKNGEKHFTAFFAVPGEETQVNDNRLADRLAEVTGARVETKWLDGQTAAEKIESMVTVNEYPDFINGSDATDALVKAGAFIPLEDYLDDYPNLKAYLTDKQWESLRKEDGHIYYIPPFGVISGRDMSTIPSGEAFWVQKRVLEWAGYPKLRTLDEYFDLIVSYLEANPTTNGAENIGFEILCDDWRYFCLENPPMFLAGYPNDGCAIVDKETQKASVYDTIPEAKQYYGKLCEMYNKGVIDPETFMLTFQQYIDKISSGRVLGFVDQYWQFMNAQNSLYANGMEECTYVPFPITANESIKGNYNCTENSLNVASGVGISVSCEDVEGALAFLDGLLSPEGMKLRNWGEEDVDYEVRADGVFYRTEEQREQWSNGEYLKKNSCTYVYFPGYTGQLADGINAVVPGEQPGEYYAGMSEYDKKILDAYGHQTWVDFVGEATDGEVWYPLYSCKGDWAGDSPYGKAAEAMENVKRRWLPKIIMSKEDEFEESWEAYRKAYDEQVDVAAYENELNAEIQRRIKAAE